MADTTPGIRPADSAFSQGSAQRAQNRARADDAGAAEAQNDRAREDAAVQGRGEVAAAERDREAAVPPPEPPPDVRDADRGARIDLFA